MKRFLVIAVPVFLLLSAILLAAFTWQHGNSNNHASNAGPQ